MACSSEIENIVEKREVKIAVTQRTIVEKTTTLAYTYVSAKPSLGRVYCKDLKILILLLINLQ